MSHVAFERFERLGEEKFRTILNTLMRGQSAMGLARLIKTEWGLFPDVSEKTLTQQLNRLRLAAAEGIYGKEAATEIQAGAAPQLRLLERVSTSAITRMEELAIIVRTRVQSIALAEEKTAITDGKRLSATTQVFSEYSKLLQDIQKMRFDLGLDEYKGIVPSVRGASLGIQLPDGTNVQKTVFEAMTTVDNIFKKRGINAADANF